MAFATAWAGLIDATQLTAGQAVVIPPPPAAWGLRRSRWLARLQAIPIALTRTASKASALRDAGAARVIVTQEADVAAEI